MKKKTKLIYIVNVDWFFISHRLPIALKALKNGYDVHLICRNSGQFDALKNQGLHVHDVNFSRSGSNLLREFITILNLRKIIKSIKPDIIHAVTIKPVLYSGIISVTLSSNPAFIAAISGLGSVFSSSNWSMKLRKFFVSKLYRLALSHKRKSIIFQNTSDQKTLNSIVNITSEEQILIKGSGVDLDEFIATEQPVGHKIRIVMACRLLKDKGVYEFVNAARVVKKHYGNIEFVLAGSVDLENPNSITQQELNDWNNEGVISAIGMCKNMATLFATSHIITLPSYYGEGVPKVLIEAAASGRPIITTNTPGCRDCVIDQVSGYLIESKDHQSLAEKIELLIKEPKLRQKMGLESRLHAEKNFDINIVIQTHLDLYAKHTNT